MLKSSQKMFCKPDISVKFSFISYLANFASAYFSCHWIKTTVEQRTEPLVNGGTKSNINSIGI